MIFLFSITNNFKSFSHFSSDFSHFNHINIKLIENMRKRFETLGNSFSFIDIFKNFLDNNWNIFIFCLVEHNIQRVGDRNSRVDEIGNTVKKINLLFGIDFDIFFVWKTFYVFLKSIFCEDLWDIFEIHGNEILKNRTFFCVFENKSLFLFFRWDNFTI